MAKTDSLLNDVLIALHLLTRLPLPAADWINEARPHARAAWAYPLVGFLVGAISIAAAWGALTLGLPASIAAGLAVASAIMVTGAMHEDGLADCADGFWGGWEPARRLEIMKDSHIGTYGVLSLIVVIGLKWAALTILLEADLFWLLVVAPTLSRSAMVVVMERLPNARDTGLSRSTGRPGPTALTSACAIGLASVFIAGFAQGLVLLLATALMSFGVMQLAKRKIGGQTGDVLGATQCSTETVLLLTLCALIP